MTADDKPRGTPFSPPLPSAKPSLGVRVLYMLIFALVFWVLCWTIAITALAQLALTLLAGRSNPELVRFGASLGAYARQIVEFLTFVSERIPYPFSEWPAP